MKNVLENFQNSVENSQNFFVYSDTHFGHQKLYESYEPVRQNLGKSFAEFEQLLVHNWNQVVKEEDTILLLGDFCINKYDMRKVHTIIEDFSSALNGKKFLLRGNHDTSPDEIYTSAGWKGVINEVGFVWKRILFSHYPASLDGVDNDIHDRYQFEKEWLAKLYTSSACILNIHGHTHSRIKSDARFYNVSCENLNFSPILFSNILQI